MIAVPPPSAPPLGPAGALSRMRLSASRKDQCSDSTRSPVEIGTNPKLGVDFVSRSRRHERMEKELVDDPARKELVLQLCTRLGMLMEDAIPVALNASPDGLRARVGDIAQCVCAMTALADAAKALMEL